MRAVVHTRYGPPDVLRVEEIDAPVPKDDEVLIEVRATTVNRTDCGFRRPDPFFVRIFSGLVRPKFQVLGTEVAGTVVAIGSRVTRFAVGDEVFGVNADRFGAHAELVCMREDAPLAHKPEGLSFAEAAAVSDGGILALTGLVAVDLQPGQRILVYGASGSIGTAAVQLAKHMGAEVTAVCDTKNLEVVRSLGPDRVIDYTAEDFTAEGPVYDVVFDAVGKSSYWRGRRLLKRGGVYATTDLGFLWQNPPLTLLTRLASKRARLPIPKYVQGQVELLKELVEGGEYRPVIDRCYPLDEVVDATRYVETEQKTGNVVLEVA